MSQENGHHYSMNYLNNDIKYKFICYNVIINMRYLLVTVFVTSMTSLSKYMDEWKDLSQVKQQRIAQVCVFSTRLESPYLHA